MQRRDFIRNTSLATAGLTVADWSMFAQPAGTHVAFENIDSSWEIHDDGTYTLTAGELVLDNCYPAFDGKPLAPKSVEIARNSGGGTITYSLKEGKVILTLSASAMGVSLESVLDVPVAPHYFYPLSFATVQGANRYFKQGLGFAGPSGVFEIPTPPVKRESHQCNESWSYDSYLTSGFFSGSGNTLAIGAYKHDNYLQRSTIFNRTYRFGLIDRHLNSNTVMFEAGFATERIELSKPIGMPALYFVAGKQPFATFRRLAENIAQANNIKPNLQPRYQWCSWYEWQSKYTQEHLNDLIAGMKAIQPPLAVSTLQIDDGYAERGDWLIPVQERYPQGIDFMAQSIQKAGYQAGIWVGPFMVSERSKVFKEHPEWLLRDLQGNLFVEGVFPEGKHYVLDTTHPQAFEYLREVFRSLRKMGFTYYKTDFMDWGLRDRTKFKRYDNSKTSVQNFVEVLKMIRAEIGQESVWLACISPFPPFIGYADAARFSNDVGDIWNDNTQGNMIQEAMACHYFQHVFWQNDPDTLFLRDDQSNLNSALTKDECYTIALWDGMIGGFVMTSDRFHKVTPEYLNLWRFLQPGKTQLSCRFPYWADNRKLRVAVRDYPEGKSWALLITNPSSQAVNESYAINDLTGMEKAWVFDWKPGENKPLGELPQLTVTLLPHQSKLFYIHRANTPPAADLGLSGIKVKGLKKI